MSWRRFRAASDASGGLGQTESIDRLHRAGDGNHRPHGSHAVLDPGALRGRAVEDRIRKTFQLSLVAVGVLTQRPVELPILHREALHLARLVVPGEINLADHTAVFTENLEAFLEIPAHGNRQVE